MIMHDWYYFTDIHGNLPLFNSIINWCKWRDPECTIIFGGDACDRGPDGYTIMRALLDDDRVIYLKGNHEDMFVKAAREIVKIDYQPSQNIEEEPNHIDHFFQACNIFDNRYPDIQLALYNGAAPTLKAWMLDGRNIEFVNQIDNLPITLSTETTDFCHAGGVYRTFQEIADLEYYFDKEGLKKREKDIVEGLLWDRYAFTCGWKNKRLLVHGHTPTCYLNHVANTSAPIPRDENHIIPIAYQGKWALADEKQDMLGWRLDMDCATAYTGDCYVFDVLTHQIIRFHDDDFKLDATQPHHIHEAFDIEHIL